MILHDGIFVQGKNVRGETVTYETFFLFLVLQTLIPNPNQTLEIHHLLCGASTP